MSRTPTQKDQKDTAVEQSRLDRFDPINRRRLSGPGLRTFLRIADNWSLTEQQRLLVLGYPYRSKYMRWCEQARLQKQLTLNVDVLMRISAVLGIYKALQMLYTYESRAIEWLRTPHGAVVFGGHPPLDLVTCGTQDGLLTVRRFLDSACQGRYMPPGKLDLGFMDYDSTDIVIRTSREV